MKIAGTEKTFELKFLYFSHKKKTWQAECMIGELQVILLGKSGKEKWFVKDLPKVKVSKNLCTWLHGRTSAALADYKELAEYKKAVGGYPAGVIQ